MNYDELVLQLKICSFEVADWKEGYCWCGDRKPKLYYNSKYRYKILNYCNYCYKALNLSCREFTEQEYFLTRLL